ncbi:MAG: hypothetical protein QOK03_755 [Candidatus Binataceae bacterium]|nr:hypothetical protein [Candidatus Binataceae bacterium]
MTNSPCVDLTFGLLAMLALVARSRELIDGTRLPASLAV